jgi:CRISPR-associated protein Cas5d
MLKEGNNNIGACLDQFRRKVERGQCHHTPYLGTREFAAWFEPVIGNAKPSEPLNLQLGNMLFDIAYRQDDKRQEIAFHHHKGQGKEVVKGYAHALYFNAVVKDNVLTVPPEKYRELYELEEINV